MDPGPRTGATDLSPRSAQLLNQAHTYLPKDSEASLFTESTRTSGWVDSLKDFSV